MDTDIRQQEKCVVGLPRCDFAFSSSRSCFIGYGFSESELEVEILKNILEGRDIIPFEAGSLKSPAQIVFCTKICSKIITSQFCIILLNNEKRNGSEYVNANVQMEYGLMLGFNKYVIPFQREGDSLYFNISGLDTMKYRKDNFRNKAEEAIDQAIEQTARRLPTPQFRDQLVESYLYSKQAVYSPIQDPGEKGIFDLGVGLGFNLLSHFDGLSYRYFGNFPQLRPEHILWRVKTIDDLLHARISGTQRRITLGIADKQWLRVVEQFKSGLEIWLLVSSQQTKKNLQEVLETQAMHFPIDIFTIEEINAAMKDLVGII